MPDPVVEPSSAPAPAPAPAPTEAPTPSPAPSGSPEPSPAPAASPAAAPSPTPEGDGATPAEMWEKVRTKFGEAKFGDLTTKEAKSVLGELGRYATMDDALAALIEAKRTLRAGQIIKPPGKDATPEAIAEWREQNGIPKEAKAYFEKLPDGLVIGDDDLPLFENFAEALHGTNAKPETIHAAVEWYNNHLQEVATHRATQDIEFRQEATQALKQQYGPLMERNLNLANTFIANQFGEDIAEALTQARTPDGRMLLDIPEVVHGFLKAQLEIDPAATVVPSGGGGVGAIDSELEKLETEFAKDRSAFYADPKKKERMDELLEMKSKIKAR